MHEWLYEKAKCLKSEIEGKGWDNLTHENLEESCYISKILRNLIEVDQAYNVIEAMKKAENDENMEMIERFTDYPERRYYNTNRYMNGRYAPKGRGRMMYDEKYKPMDVDMYRDEDYDSMRQLDRKMGRMYYTAPTGNTGMNTMSTTNGMTTTRDVREGNAGKARVRYYESKSTNDKNTKMHELDEYMQSLSKDVTEMIVDASPEEKTLLKSKLQTLMAKI